MPTLLQINVTANWGSTGKIAEQIGQKAMFLGWESYIAYGRMMNPSSSRLIKIGHKSDVYFHYTKGRFLDEEGLASRKATKELLHEIDNINPSIVHLHNIHDHYLNYPLLFNHLSIMGIPVVWTQHDQWASTGSCCYTPADCEKWKVQCIDCPLRTGFINKDGSKRNYLLKERLFTSLASLTLVPVSDWLAELLKVSFFKDTDIRVIHNGIDTSVFRPIKGQLSVLGDIGDKKVVLGVAAVWDQRKGLQDFYKLSELLPFDEYVIVIVGKIQKRIESPKGVQNNIIFVDRTQNVEELALLYSMAMVFVNPTYQDNYPTTNLEAMACGTPVITYRTGGSPEAITDETGWVVEQGDVEGIASIIKNLNKKDKVEIDAQRRACRDRAVKEFNKDKCYEKYISLYESLLQP